jgi:hypothetical protein
MPISDYRVDIACLASILAPAFLCVYLYLLGLVLVMAFDVAYALEVDRHLPFLFIFVFVFETLCRHRKHAGVTLEALHSNRQDNPSFMHTAGDTLEDSLAVFNRYIILRHGQIGDNTKGEIVQRELSWVAYMHLYLRQINFMSYTRTLVKSWV